MAEVKQIILTLPYPPTVNTYWRRAGHRTIISDRGRAYTRAVSDCLWLAGVKEGFGSADLAAMITVYPPDKRRRDIDNVLKAVFDSLQKAGLFDDDSQIVKLFVEKGEQVPAGVLKIKLFDMPSDYEIEWVKRDAASA